MPALGRGTDTGPYRCVGLREVTMDDRELARRSVTSLGEIIALVGRWGVGPEAAIRRPDAVGAAIPWLEANPWFDAVVVPLGTEPPADDPRLPHCLWTTADHVPGRVPDPSISMPCMGLDLREPLPFPVVAIERESPEPSAVGALNDRAYGTGPVLARLAVHLRDDRLRTHGVRIDGSLASAAMTLDLGDDLAVHYVATAPEFRRRGLATRLLADVISEARNRGMRTTTLQASPDGLPVYRAMGFREVGMLRAFVRPDSRPGRPEPAGRTR
jgi:GNAT superfamily N-acetyltransferase